KDYDGAIADYDEALKLDPLYALAWMNRGSARQGKGEYAQALADFAEATRLNPKAPEGYAHRAWVLATCPDATVRNGKEAVNPASEAVERAGPTAHHYLDVRAAAHAEDGDFAAAIVSEQRAIDLAAKRSPKDLEADQTLAALEGYRSRLKLYQAN